MTRPTRGAARDCPFCERIKRGEYDYGNDDNVAFQPLNPVTPGHFLVVPTKHVSNALESPSAAGRALQFAGYLANQMDLGAANFITSAGHDATQTVFHLHIHVVPRREGDGLALPWTGQQSGAAAQPAPYPRQDGEFTVIGPECFTDRDGTVIAWKGENYYRQRRPA